VNEPRAIVAPGDGTEMLRLENVRKVYRTGLLETEALADATMQVARGEFVAVMGPSGSGKTTLLSVIGLLDGIDGGRYQLDGKDVGDLSDAATTAMRNLHIGFVFQSFNLIPDFDVFDNVAAPLVYRGMPRAERRRRVEASLERVGLTARRHHLPGQLSGGQQQRAAIARALAGEPRLLLADEPTGNLDSAMARQIIDLLLEINAAGTTILMVTHDADLAARAQRTLHVLDGRVIDPQRPRMHGAAHPA
jgi:putative ABC transport system ATP-binding protein